MTEDSRTAGVRQFYAEQEARRAQFAAFAAEAREIDRPRREAEAQALAEAREAARNAPAGNAATVAGDVRQAVTGSRDGDSSHARTLASIRDKSRELAAIARLSERRES